MDWDVLGLPVEDRAIERDIYTAERTVENREIMKEQMVVIILNFNWSKISTLVCVRMCRNDDEGVTLLMGYNIVKTLL